MSENYHSLQIFKYSHPEEDITLQYQARINSPATINTHLKINPMQRGIRQGITFNLFAMPIKELLQLQDAIQQNSNRISNLLDQLPGIAANQLFINTLKNEIRSTNDIEDVKTTNAEVNEAIASAQNNTKRKTRLKSFARMYLKIKDKQNLQIKNVEDIRKIYDYLLEGEIPSNKMPDGRMFRNRFARIGSEIETVHQPKVHEADFLPDLLDWISFINDDSIPFLIKTFISHYYFEYVHPFNDGNGRTGRYIACVYLGYKLDSLSAITFSSEINKNRTKYYKAFSEASDSRNYGEMTFFILNMMEILANGQSALIHDLKEKQDLLNYFLKAISSSTSDKLEMSILFLHAQASLFNDTGFGIEDRELKQYTKDFHWTQVKQCLNKLTQNGSLTLTKKSPLTRRLSKSFLTQITES